MIKIEKAILDEKTINELCELSRIWMEEDISWGIVANTKEDLIEPIYVAKDNDKIIGYSFGSCYESKKKFAGIEEGSKCFSVDELYVLPEYRSRGIGRQLYRVLVDEMSKNVDFITLSTSTKSYNKILKFYCEDLGLTFHDAFLFKKVEK